MESLITTSMFAAFLLMAKLNKKSILLSFLFLMYSLTILASLSLQMLGFYQRIETIPSLFLVAILLFWFTPYLGIQKKHIVGTKINIRFIKAITIAYSTFLIPALFVFLYYTVLVFTSKDLSSFRLESQATGIYSLLPNNIIITIFSHLSATYFIPLLLCFFSITKNLSNKYVYLNLLSSLSFPCLILAYAGRDGVFYWLLDALLLFLIFRSQLSLAWTKRLKRIAIISTLCLLAPIFSITTYRFVRSGMNTDIFSPILNYLGQQLGNFNDAFRLDTTFDGTLFPGLAKLFGLNNAKNEDKLTILYQKGLETEFNVFGYFVKEQIWRLGKVGTVLFSSIYFTTSTFIKKSYLSSGSFVTLAILLCLYHYPLMGMFYFRQLVGNMDLSYLISFIMILTISSFFKSNQIKSK